MADPATMVITLFIVCLAVTCVASVGFIWWVNSFLNQTNKQTKDRNVPVDK